MNKKILVCCGTGCISAGSLEVAEALRRAVREAAGDAGNSAISVATATATAASATTATTTAASAATDASVTNDAATAAASAVTVETVVKQTGCNGFCENGPIVNIMPDDISYYKVKPKDAPDIVASLGAKPVERLLYKVGGKPVLNRSGNPFYAGQHKVALRNIGLIDPGELPDYIERSGYAALRKALAMSPDEIIGTVEASGLRGRGGAGFPTGRKWRIASGYEPVPKYVVCNGDEGDPGAFMDRSILEGDPHTVLEGMAICALAIGAQEGFLYIRDEYALALKHVNKAIRDAEAAGILGDDILGSGRRLRLTVVRGGGAFVCGESTALMASIEGRVGEPRAKYIRSVQRGLWDMPTVLNNVETFANIPYIIENGAGALAAIGSERSKGTKVFAMVGKVKRTGLVEVPMGVTLRRLIYDIGGGVIGDRPFKAVQIGGPSGGCLPAEMLDLPVDFDALVEYGAMMGSGGLIVMDDRSCMVEVARYYAGFLAGESCGKCTPCREGLRQTLAILTDICEGRGMDGDIEMLEQICAAMADSSLCALGKSAPNPVLTTIKYFRSEYDAHIYGGCCPAGVCSELTAFIIDPDACVGCALCKRACPVNAVIGEPKAAHVIDAAACISCGACREACRHEAVATASKKKTEYIL